MKKNNSCQKFRDIIPRFEMKTTKNNINITRYTIEKYEPQED